MVTCVWCDEETPAGAPCIECGGDPAGPFTAVSGMVAARQRQRAARNALLASHRAAPAPTDPSPSLFAPTDPSLSLFAPMPMPAAAMPMSAPTIAPVPPPPHAGMPTGPVVAAVPPPPGWPTPAGPAPSPAWPAPPRSDSPGNTGMAIALAIAIPVAILIVIAVAVTSLGTTPKSTRLTAAPATSTPANTNAAGLTLPLVPPTSAAPAWVPYDGVDFSARFPGAPLEDQHTMQVCGCGGTFHMTTWTAEQNGFAYSVVEIMVPPGEPVSPDDVVQSAVNDQSSSGSGVTITPTAQSTIGPFQVEDMTTSGPTVSGFARVMVGQGRIWILGARGASAPPDWNYFLRSFDPKAGSVPAAV